MKKLLKSIGKEKIVVFLDLEGTQFSHELISLGACKAKLKRDGTFGRLDKGFQVYVKSKKSIGKFVEKLTHITEETLVENGLDYVDAMTAFKKYVGRDYKKAKYVTFGSHDIRIFSQSEIHSGPSLDNFFTIIKSNHVDLSKIISEYIKDDKNNPLSLINYCKLFNVNLSGSEHEALSDARTLAYLYNAILKNPDIISREYMKIIESGRGMPRPVQKIIKKIREDGKVDSTDLERFVKEEIKGEKVSKR